MAGHRVGNLVGHHFALRSERIHTMNRNPVALLVFTLLFLCDIAVAQKLTADVPYLKNGHARHVLDIYTPEKQARNRLPVVFWIHGGGSQVGDKGDVSLKPKVLTERGLILVSTNYRLLPEVTMDELVGDVARSLGWVYRNIARYGGDPEQIIVGGHSAGARRS